MLSFDNAAAIAAATTTVTEETLRRLVADRVHDWTATDLLGLTHLLVVEHGDREGEIVQAVGFSPLVDPADGQRFGSGRFEPFWDWLERHDGWFEMIVTVGNDGFAFVLMIADERGVDPGLLTLCRQYADSPEKELIAAASSAYNIPEGECS